MIAHCDGFGKKTHPTALTQRMFSPLFSKTHACVCQKKQKKLKESLESNVLT
jgi:hypothetical protein